MPAHTNSLRAAARHRLWLSLSILAACALVVIGLIRWGLYDKARPLETPSLTYRNDPLAREVSQPIGGPVSRERELQPVEIYGAANETPAEQETPQAPPEKPKYVGRVLPGSIECLRISWCNPERKSLTTSELNLLDGLINTLNIDIDRAQTKLMSRRHELGIALAKAGQYVVRAPGEVAAIMTSPGVSRMDVIIGQGPPVTVLVEHGNDAVCVQLSQDLEALYSYGMDAIQNYILVNGH